MSANTAQKISEYSACNAPSSNDLVMVLKHNTDDTYSTRKSTIEQLFSNVIANTLVVSMNTTPVSNSANGYITGQMWSDGTYLYVVGANGIGRITLDYF